MDSELKPMLFRMAKAIVQQIVLEGFEATASSPEEQEFNNFTTTLAHFLRYSFTSEGLMWMATLDAKNLEQRKLPEENYEQPKVSWDA
jgi:hypothetical protein